MRKIIKTNKDGITIRFNKIDIIHNIDGTTTFMVDYLKKGKVAIFPLKLRFNLTKKELIYLIEQGEEKTI